MVSLPLGKSSIADALEQLFFVLYVGNQYHNWFSVFRFLVFNQQRTPYTSTTLIKASHKPHARLKAADLAHSYSLFLCCFLLSLVTALLEFFTQN